MNEGFVPPKAATQGDPRLLQPREATQGDCSQQVNIGELIESHKHGCRIKLKRLDTIKGMLPSQPSFEQIEALLWLLSRNLD